jgi:hypothetical protein
VIASGGVGNLDHLADGIQIGGADAVLAASIFHYGEFTVGRPSSTWPSAAFRCGCNRSSVCSLFDSCWRFMQALERPKASNF